MAMSAFEKEVIDRLGRIETKLDVDFRTLHGSDSKAGLVERVETLEKHKAASGLLFEAFCWIVGIIVAICGVLAAWKGTK